MTTPAIDWKDLYVHLVFPAGAGVILPLTKFTSSTVQVPGITGVSLAYGIPINQLDFSRKWGFCSKIYLNGVINAI